MTEQNSSQPLNILVVDDEINVRKTLAISLETDGYSVTAVSNARDALAEAARHSFDLAFVDLRLGADSGTDLIPKLLTQSPWMRIVIITAHGSIDSAVETMKRGAADYLTKPFTPVQVKLVVERIARLRALEQKVAGLEEIVGQSRGEMTLKSSDPVMQRTLNLARQVAPSDTTVLIRGESGTGKGVLARAIHGWSNRAKKPMATISCPTLSPQLLESELFGHARGSFTGAIRDNPGRIAASEGGTLFLDEIGDLPLQLQPKLLRFLQDREYERVGESQTRRADVRVIAATHVDLEAAVANGKFREDLLYRVKVIQLDLPPLRDRPDDVIAFAEQFLAELAHGKPIVGFTPDAIAALRAYRWPGNIRELRNVIERALFLCLGNQIGPEHLPNELASQKPAPQSVGDSISLDQLEEMHIRRVLAKAKSLDEAAKILDIDVATLWRKRQKYGL
ncbi:MAG TPA: sigma-54 dependent transcriptional regulator [Tepidisphaeraceae bacterium]